MPSNQMIETGRGFVAQAVVKAGPDGKLSDQAIITLAGQLEAVRRAVNGGLSLGTGEQSSRAGNLDAQFRTVRFTDANAPVLIPHALGRVPIGYLVTLSDRACNLYAANLGGWGLDVFYLSCNTAGSLVQLIVF